MEAGREMREAGRQGEGGRDRERGRGVTEGGRMERGTETGRKSERAGGWKGGRREDELEIEGGRTEARRKEGGARGGGGM